MPEKFNEYIAVIPARSGSIGVKNKNTKKINGHPLIAYTIEAAKQSKNIKKIFVSTDGKEIASVARKYGAEVIDRPKKLAGSIIMPDEAVTHAINFLEKKGLKFKNVVFFQPTSALRKKGDVDRAIDIYKKKGANSLFTSSDMHVTIWKENNRRIKPINHSYKNRKRRQDSASQYIENGSFYITNKNIYKNTNLRLGGIIETYVMENWSIFEIDNIKDYKTVELILSSGIGKKEKIVIPKI